MIVFRPADIEEAAREPDDIQGMYNRIAAAQRPKGYRYVNVFAIENDAMFDEAAYLERIGLARILIRKPGGLACALLTRQEQQCSALVQSLHQELRNVRSGIDKDSWKGVEDIAMDLVEVRIIKVHLAKVLDTAYDFQESIFFVSEMKTHHLHIAIDSIEEEIDTALLALDPPWSEFEALDRKDS